MIGKTIRGNLLVTSFLGSGAMGTVYLAENVNLPDKKYAIKILRSELTDDAGFQARFYLEAQNQSKLSHPNIVDVVDYFAEGDCYFLVLAYIDGKALDVVIREEAPLAEARVLSVFRGILEGLDCAHKHGIVHRDVKPSNVLIGNDGRARIVDFGIAIQAGTTRMTATGTAVGTAAYMSPEQIARPQSVDHRSDVYSAGVVLYEMLTGQVPFEGATAFEIHEQHVNRPPPDPRKTAPGLSPGLTAIVLKSLEKDPAKRYAGCGDFLASLEAYSRIVPPLPKSPVRWIVAAASIAVVAGVGFVVYRSATAPPPAPIVTTITRVVDSAPGAPVALVAATRQALVYFCQNLERVPRYRKGKQDAALIGDSGQTDQFEARLVEVEGNLVEHSTQYVDDLRQLAAMDKGRVKAALSDAASSAAKSFQGEVAKDYDAIVAGGNVSRASMEGSCGASLPR